MNCHKMYRPEGREGLRGLGLIDRTTLFERAVPIYKVHLWRNMDEEYEEKFKYVWFNHKEGRKQAFRKKRNQQKIKL